MPDILMTVYTSTGKIGVQVARYDFKDRAVYSYNGLWGAGSGRPLGEIRETVNTMLSRRKGYSVTGSLD